MAKSFISVEGLSRRFPVRGGGELAVFEDLWFSIERGEFVCVIGHSGCGKSTILNVLAGLDEPTSGEIIVNGEAISGPSLDRAVIFQGHALLPWLSAMGNIELAISSRHPEWSRAEIRAHAERYLELVHLEGAAAKRPSELSGGMKQRVGIARALSIEPKVLLMDEPFSALDALTRGALQDEVIAIQSKTQQTTFMITHDVDEALLLADKILMMTNGPNAYIAEIVENTLPRSRTRNDIHKHPNYYPLRNHLIDFLVTRSKELAKGPGRQPGVSDAARRNPPVVRPAQGEAEHAHATFTPKSTEKASYAFKSRPNGAFRTAARRIGAQGPAQNHRAKAAVETKWR
ncbi:MAG: ABC transporter ATP-binding protein [Hyphomicrobiaceae bacterium]|nr:ABC transporter ATP-binding protein [Hyphomicrobiaceae bacterium]